MKDVQNCCSSTEYINTIVAAAKRCDQKESKFENVMQVWIHINLPLQKAIDESSPDITIRQFMSILQSKQLNWYNEFSQHHHELTDCDCGRQNQHQQPDRNCLFQNLSFSNQTFISRFSAYSYCPSYFNNCRSNRSAFSYASYVSYDRSSYSGQFSTYNYGQSNNHQQKQNCRAGNEDSCCQIINSQQSLQIMAENNKRSSSDSYQTYSNTNCSFYEGTDRNAGKLLYCSYQYEQPYQTNHLVWAYHEDVITDVVEQDEYQVYKNAYYEDVYWQKQAEKNNSADTEDAVEKSMKKKLDTENDTVNVNHIVKTKKCLLCCICHLKFSLNNHLHKHIQKGCIKLLKILVCEKLLKTSMKATSALMQTTLMIVTSQKLIYVRLTIMETTHNDYEFWEWCYATAEVWLICDGEISSVCLNTECTMILVDWQFLKKKILNLAIQQTFLLITVCELSSNTHESSKFTVVDLYLSDEHRWIAVIFCEMHLINNLKTCMLIEIDILISEKITLDMAERKATIESCDNVKIPLTIMLQSESYWLKQIVLWQNLCRYDVETDTELDSLTYWVVDSMGQLIEWSTQQINQTSHWLNVWVCWVCTI